VIDSALTPPFDYHIQAYRGDASLLGPSYPPTLNIRL
jgi:hypothetical protein